VLIVALLTLISYVERLYAEMGRFLSREFQENIEVFEQKIEPAISDNRNRVALSMSLLERMCIVALALISGYVIFADGTWTWLQLAQAIVLLVLVVVVFSRLLPYVFFTRTRGAWLMPFAPLLTLLTWAMLPITLFLGFAHSVAALAEPHEPEEPEHPSEAVDALIEAGQEEGILEESDRQLIQSVVEFGDKTVREVMTPRPEITAVPVNASVEEFTELLRNKPYSRVPVFEKSLDDIKGIVFAHDVLQIPDTEAGKTRVGALMRPVQFVPETQLVRSLLRDMQRENVHMAMVIDEYGGVSGLVTIEDLVEEIVGEIRDEHEAKGDIVRETEDSYIVPANMDVDRLVTLFNVRPEEAEATTVGGMLVEMLGRIPSQGEVVEQDGLRYEVLEATERRVERLRISKRTVPPS
jgi:CBS domain containing-hemolysin-like protein